MPRKELAKGQLRALRVDETEIGLEGNFWLCLICGVATQASEQQAHAIDLFEASWWIVEIMWYEYQQGTSPRKYKFMLPKSRRWLVVNA